MASDAVVLNHPLPGLVDLNYLWFQSQRENCGMPHAVLCLKEVMTENIVMRNMAVVAMGILPMRVVRPCRVLGCHDVAVNAGFGIVRQVSVSPGNVKREEEKAEKNAKGQDYGQSPDRRGKDMPDNFHHRFVCVVKVQPFQQQT